MPNQNTISNYIEQLSKAIEEITPEAILSVANQLKFVCEKGGTVWVCGNGGSASTASHMACDLSKNVAEGSNRLRVVSLTDNMAHFSAIANDLDYDQVFVEQLRNVMMPKDAVVTISASGNSPNVVKAAEFARASDIPVFAMTGFSGGALRDLATESLHVDCNEYGPVEDLHLIFNHLLVVTLRSLIDS